MIGNIQLLRALAAYMVVGHHIIDAIEHYFGGGRYHLGIDTLASGVDLFFVISGFIMATTTIDRPQHPWTFLRHRIVRVVPLYALFTLLAVAGLAAGLKLFGKPSWGWSEVWHALTFTPSLDAAGHVQKPILFVGWSLEYEMAFYAVVAMLLPIRSIALRASALAVLLIGLVLLGHGSDSARLRYYADPLVLEFLAGYGLCLLLRRWTPPALLGALALGVGSVMLAMTVTREMDWAWRALHFGVPAVLMVFGAVALSRRGIDTQHPFALAHGDASYALYLVHPFVIQLLGKIANQFAWSSSVPGVVFWSVALLLVCGAAGLFVHRQVERRIQRALRPQRDSTERPAARTMAACPH